MVRRGLQADAVAREPNCDNKVYDANEPIPAGLVDVGTVHLGDSGFTANCDRARMLDELRKQSCLAGADAAQVLHVIQPSFSGSSCYRLTAALLRREPLGAH